MHAMNNNGRSFAVSGSLGMWARDASWKCRMGSYANLTSCVRMLAIDVYAHACHMLSILLSTLLSYSCETVPGCESAFRTALRMICQQARQLEPTGKSKTSVINDE